MPRAVPTKCIAVVMQYCRKMQAFSSTTQIFTTNIFILYLTHLNFYCHIVVSDKVTLLWENYQKFLFLVIVNSVIFTALNGRAGKGESTSALPLCFFTYLHKLCVACLLLTFFLWSRMYVKVLTKNKVSFFEKKLIYVYKIRIKFWNN